MTIRILVVDDEPLAREGVVFQLQDESDVDVVGQCVNGTEAVQAIRELSPDLVYLDIRMPKMSGFDVIQAVGPDSMPLVVFLTAYDEHALEAFRLNALDYLLKPIERRHFQESLRKARERLRERQLLAQGDRLNSLLVALGNGAPVAPERTSRIALRLGGQITFLAPDELDWIEADGDYVSVHAGPHTHLVRETMQSMEQRLQDHGFARIHRSAIVNLDKIAKLLASDNGDYEALLHNGKTLKVGRNYRTALFARMKIEP